MKDFSSYQPSSSFPLEPSSLLFSPVRMIDEGDTHSISSCFPNFPVPFTDINAVNIECSYINQPVVIGKQKTHSSSSIAVHDHLESYDHQVPEMQMPVPETSRKGHESSLKTAQSKDPEEAKGKKRKKCSNKLNKTQEKEIKDSQLPPTGYVHVRARRGQATDSHSLAERVRRKKLSEKMKLLQSLVPGCDMVTSKLSILEEIINYMQYLQHSVEFLSMKLASVNQIFHDVGLDFDALMVYPNFQMQSSSASPLQYAQQSMPISTHVVDATTTFNEANNYFPVLDSLASINTPITNREIMLPPAISSILINDPLC